MQFSISSTALKDIVYTDSLFIDLRDPYQFQKQHVINFINIPYHHFINQITKLPKNKPIYLICQSGKLARKEADNLRLQNYQAYYIEGGMNALLNTPASKYY